MTTISNSRKKDLLCKANSALEKQKVILSGDNTILEGYNGQVASLSVSIAMSGLMPTLAIFYQDKPDGNVKKAFRRNVLDAIARMIILDKPKWKLEMEAGEYSEKLLRYSDNYKDNKELIQEIIDCAIALKQVVRTYKLVKS